MLGGERVGQRERLVEVVDDDDLAVVAPGRPGEVPGRHAGQQPLDVRDAPRRAERRAGGDQDGRRVGAVLGLAEQVDRDDERVGVVVGDRPGSRSARRTGRCRPRRRAAASPRPRRRCPARRSGRPADRLGAERHARRPPARRRAGRSRRRRPGAWRRPWPRGSRRGSAACRPRPAPPRPPWRSRSVMCADAVSG